MLIYIKQCIICTRKHFSATSPSLVPLDPTYSGTLFVVATPLGNLEDMTFRAVRILQECSTIACEDTRRASQLLNHYAISGKSLISYHAHNEERAVGRIVALLEGGNNVALITDAGTPAVSDPGYRLLVELHEREIPVVPIPGPSALTTALSVAPLPLHSFYFAGFLPHKKGRQGRLKALASMQVPFVLYESPHRIGRLFDELAGLVPDARLFVGREMTKLYEEYLTGTALELQEHFSDGKVRGEFVVIVVPPEGIKPVKPEAYHADHHRPETDADHR